jgi:hypothetical protein
VQHISTTSHAVRLLGYASRSLATQDPQHTANMLLGRCRFCSQDAPGPIAATAITRMPPAAIACWPSCCPCKKASMQASFHDPRPHAGAACGIPPPLAPLCSSCCARPYTQAPAWTATCQHADGLHGTLITATTKNHSNPYQSICSTHTPASMRWSMRSWLVILR